MTFYGSSEGGSQTSIFLGGVGSANNTTPRNASMKANLVFSFTVFIRSFAAILQSVLVFLADILPKRSHGRIGG